MACGGGGGGSSPQSAQFGPDEIPAGPLSLGGTITVPVFAAVDIDTNDIEAPPLARNNRVSSAQPIPNPGSVRGYINEAGEGNPGPLQAPGDLHDFYSVDLLAGQQLRLSISDHDASNPRDVDIDLLLVNMDNEIVDFSVGIGPKEQLLVETSDEYLIVVTACLDNLLAEPLPDDQSICGQGATNYLLSVGQQAVPIPAGALTLSAEFVPDEALVEYRAAGQSRGAAAAPPRGAQRVRFPRSAERALAARRGAPRGAGGPLRLRPEQRRAAATLARVRALHADAAVAWAEPNFLRKPQAEPNDPGYAFQWHYPLIDLPAAWDITLGDPGVIVGVVDSGILAGHPDISGQLIGGYDFVSDIDNAGDGDGIDADPEDPGDGGEAGFSSSFHGTHVTGTVAASANNNLGVSGVAPDVRVMPLRALGQDGGSVFDVRRAMCYAAGVSGTAGCPAVPGVPANPTPVDVINLSLGGGSPSQTEQQAIDDIRAAGVTLIAAAGNDSTSELFYPAAYDGVIAVSAVTIQKDLAPYSSFGSYIDVAAPGGDLSTDIDGDGYSDGVLSIGGDDTLATPEFTYPFFQGTSMAAPHMAGVVALMKSVNNSLGPEDFDRLLAAGALTEPQDDGPWTPELGFGLINARQAVNAALNEPGGGSGPAPDPFLTVNPRSLNFGTTLDELQIELRNSSGGSLSVTSMQSDAFWLQTPPVGSANGGLGEYILQVSRAGLNPGTYSATVTIVTTVNTVRVPVIMQVSQIGVAGDAGLLRVQLQEVGSGLTREVTVTADSGAYRYSIDALPPGTYRLFAFSDADNDAEVCDPGEACGAYLTNDQPLLIELERSEPALNFTVSYGIEASGQ